MCWRSITFSIATKHFDGMILGDSNDVRLLVALKFSGSGKVSLRLDGSAEKTNVGNLVADRTFGEDSTIRQSFRKSEFVDATVSRFDVRFDSTICFVRLIGKHAKLTFVVSSSEPNSLTCR